MSYILWKRNSQNTRGKHITTQLIVMADVTACAEDTVIIHVPAVQVALVAVVAITLAVVHVMEGAKVDVLTIVLLAKAIAARCVDMGATNLVEENARGNAQIYVLAARTHAELSCMDNNYDSLYINVQSYFHNADFKEYL